MLRLSQVAFIVAAFALVAASKSKLTAPFRSNVYLNQPGYLNGLSGGGLFTNRYQGLFTGSNLGNRNDKCGRQLRRQNCPLFDFRSNLVTMEDFIVKVMSEENGWFPLLTIEDQSDTLGKCNTKWNFPDGSGVFVKPEVCYNLDKGTCDIFSEIMRITEDECGRVLLVGVNSSSTESIYSQDLDRYFWRDLCVNRDGDTCRDGQYFDLNVRGSRFVNTPDRAADITGLPWDLIAADLKNVFGRNIGDPNVRHSYLGIECPFPG